MHLSIVWVDPGTQEEVQIGRQAVDIPAGKTVKLKPEGSIEYGTNLAPEVKTEKCRNCADVRQLSV